MKHSHLSCRLLALALLSALGTSALAQVVGTSPFTPSPPEERLREGAIVRASRIATKARERFRRADYEEAESLSTQAIELYRSFDIRLACAEADDVLAEVAMVRNNPRLALRFLHDAPHMGDGILSWRGRMTRVLALLAVGRNEEARASLLQEAGTPADPMDWRSFPGDWDLPMDRDSSSRGLAATAYVLRVSHDRSTSDPDVLSDLREAEKLAPGGAAVRLMIADQLFRREQFDEAGRYYTLAAAINEPRARAMGKRGLERVKAEIAARARAKVGG